MQNDTSITILWNIYFLVIFYTENFTYNNPP